MTHFKKMSAFTIINFIPKIFTTQKNNGNFHKE